MAKRPAKKAIKPAKKPPGKAEKRPRGDTDELLPEQLAQMWILREEGHSLRKIAAEIGCHPRTVSREFEKDPARHAALVRAQAEERAALWRQVENKALRVLSDAVEDAGKVLRTESGRVKRQFSEADLKRVHVLRSLIGPLRLAADSATNRSQLLTGKPTQIVTGDPAVGGLGLDPSNMTDDEIIMLAVHHGLEAELPAALQERLTRMGGPDAVRQG